MELLVIRHAIAEDKEEFATTGAPDSARPLTVRGRKRMRECATALHALLPRFDVLATSPFRRARETAEIVADVYGGCGIYEVEALQPEGTTGALTAWLGTLRGIDAVAIVGHEPSLGQHVSWWLAGGDASFAPLTKGGAVLLDFKGPARQAAGELVWALPSRVLRTLADAG